MNVIIFTIETLSPTTNTLSFDAILSVLSYVRYCTVHVQLLEWCRDDREAVRRTAADSFKLLLEDSPTLLNNSCHANIRVSGIACSVAW